MNKTAWAIIGVIIVVLVIVFGMAGDKTEAPEGGEETNEVSVTLLAQNNSGESGTAVISEVGGMAKVMINLSGAPAEGEPAHIHLGACPTPGAVKYPLSSVINGVSETMLSVSVAELMDQLPLAVNVHRSADDLKTYVACGDVIK